jgi:hypothetical protein
MDIFNSFLTPDIPVNVVAPVNWSAIYELAKGKNRYVKMRRIVFKCPSIAINFVDNKTASIPVIQPLTAKDLKGMKWEQNRNRAPVTRISGRAGETVNHPLRHP